LPTAVEWLGIGTGHEKGIAMMAGAPAGGGPNDPEQAEKIVEMLEARPE